MLVDDLDRALDHPVDRLALGVLLRGLLDHRREDREADIGGGRLRVEPAVDVPGDVVGGQFLAIVPHDALAQIERPALEVFRSGPAFGQHRPCDVVRPRHRNIFESVACLVRHLHPGIGRRILHLLDLHRDLQDAARLGLGIVCGERQAAGGESGSGQTDQRIGRCGRRSKQRGDPDKFAPVHAPCFRRKVS